MAVAARLEAVPFQNNFKLTHYPTFTAGCWEKCFDIYFLVQIQGTRRRGFSVRYGVTQGWDDRHDKVKRL